MEVSTPQRSYEVLIGAGARSRLPELVEAHPKVAILADAALAEQDVMLPGAVRLRLEAGEQTKTLDGLGRVLGWLEESGVGRDGALVVVGGGSLGDLGGLAASIWQRGIALYQLPTTLLAMVDSAVGGKTGVNSARAKNAIGTFWQPRAVVADLELLRSLPATEYVAAFGEIAKYGVAMDAELFALLERERTGLLDRDPGLLEPVVARCLRAKAGVVGADERDETGIREILNYGHTVAHGIEAASGFEAAHGRAVSQGMRAAARIAASLGLCGAELVEAQDELLAGYGLPGDLPPVTAERVLAALPRDKKARGGEVRWVMPRAIGRAETGHRVPPEAVEAVVRALFASSA